MCGLLNQIIQDLVPQSVTSLTGCADLITAVDWKLAPQKACVLISGTWECHLTWLEGALQIWLNSEGQIVTEGTFLGGKEWVIWLQKRKMATKMNDRVEVWGQSREWGQPAAAGKDRAAKGPSEAPEWSQPGWTLILAEWNVFETCKTDISVFFVLLNPW